MLASRDAVTVPHYTMVRATQQVTLLNRPARFSIQIMSTAKKAHASRQQPGLACEACRSKKLRCNRERPQCGTCRAANIACVVDFDRLARGRKSNVKSLQTKIGMYPSQLRGRARQLTCSVNLTRRLADMEKQQSSEVSTTEIFDESQLNGIDDFIFSDQMDANVTTSTHGPSVQTSGNMDKPLEHHATPNSTPALTFDGSVEFTGGSDLCIQPIHQRQDSAMETKLFDDLFLPNLSDPSANSDISMFDAQGSLGGAVDLGPSKKAWPPPLLDLSDLTCADLYYPPPTFYIDGR
jgi:hypothetical protein